MLTERHFKNEDNIKAKIVAGHRLGVCDSDGRSVRKMNTGGRRVFVAKSRFHQTSVTKKYVYDKEGKLIHVR